ncbi:unnamed protein product, partial [Leptidea sinapis]
SRTDINNNNVRRTMRHTIEFGSERTIFVVRSEPSSIVCEYYNS